MSQFSRKTIIAAVETIEAWGHSDIDRLMLEYSLEETAGKRYLTMSRMDRANALIGFLLKNPDATTEEGTNLTDAVVRDLSTRAIRQSGEATSWNPDPFGTNFAAFSRALKRDGYIVKNGELRAALPETLNLPAADDEVHALLKTFAFATPLGHLDQAIKNHAEGNWAAANGQLRSFVDALLHDMATKLAADPKTVPPPGHECAAWLAKCDPPILLVDLNEWTGRGTGFIEGFRTRLNPQGPHPGLSHEDDCTFRLHLALLVSQLLLRRLQAAG